jgi:hypothetical protein
MEQNRTRLDQLLDTVRSAPPFITSASARQFILAHSSATQLEADGKTRKTIRTFIFVGGIVAIIAVIAIILNLNPMQRQAAESLYRVQIAEPIPANAVADDSVQSIRKAQTTAPSSTDRSRDMPVTTGNPCDPDYILARSNLFASWTRDRIQGYNIHELDSLELRSIGIVVADDGTVWTTQGSTAEGMKEERQGKSTLWFLQGIPKAKSSADSARLAEQFREGEPDAKLRDVNHPIQVAEEINVYPVLVTNSRGYTFSRSYENRDPGDPSAIGSGKYKDQELVAIRVPFKGISIPADTAGYFYIYWYEPSEEFLSLLPPRIRQEIAQRQETRRTVAAAGDKLASGLTASTLHPNPVTQDVARLDYTLREASRVAVSVYDITGERVKHVAVTDQRDPGKWQETFSVAGIPDGYYLLAVTTDKGEQRIHPMVLKR